MLYVLENLPARAPAMYPAPKPSLSPNSYAYESEPMVKPTGFREYDARWLFETEIT
jgi:phosphomannomutase/phosphoglucomutase